MTAAPLSAETVKNFLYASTATVSMQMLKRGFRNCAVNGVRPLNPNLYAALHSRPRGSRQTAHTQ
jgi:hypothetical protein